MLSVVGNLRTGDCVMICFSFHSRYLSSSAFPRPAYFTGAVAYTIARTELRPWWLLRNGPRLPAFVGKPTRGWCLFMSSQRCSMWDLRSATMLTERWLVVSYRRCGTTYRSHLQGSNTRIAWPLKVGTICCPKNRWLGTNRCCVTSQKSEVLIYTTAEAWNDASRNLFRTDECMLILQAAGTRNATLHSTLRSKLLSRTWS